LRKKILATLILALVPGLGLADVTYEEKTDFSGMMGAFMKATKSSTRVSGNFMRTDNGSNATIIDLDGEKVITLDTKKKTYSVMTFAEMKQKMESAMAAMKGQKGQEGKTAEAKKQEGASDASMKADVRVTDTGRTETIQGLACKQYLMELDMTVSSEKEKQSGTMTTVTETWLTKSAPGQEEVNAFYAKMAAKMGTMTISPALMGGGQGQNPQMSADMQKMADEMKKMEGHSMRYVVYFGSPEAAKKEAMGQKPEGGGGGGLGGMLKKMKQQGGENQGGGAQGGEAQGGVMMKLITETTKIDTNKIDPKVFAVPEGYKQVAAQN
jgi:hypothetical protein